MSLRTMTYILMVSLTFVVVSCAKDTTKPKGTREALIAFMSPPDGATRFGVVDVEVAVNDDDGVTQVDLFVNGSLIESDTSEPYTFAWDMGTQTAGTQSSLIARETDVFGNISYSDTLTVTYGVTHYPVGALLTPAQGTSVAQGTKVTFSGTATDEDEASSNLTVMWSSDLQGSLGEGTTLEHRGLIIGTHTITMTAIDSNGMISQGSPTVTVVVLPNALDYATVEKGTYYIASPLFNKSSVTFTRAFEIKKTEISIQDFWKLWGEMRKAEDAAKWKTNWENDVKARNNILYNPTKGGLYTFQIFSYTTSDPVNMVYGQYPVAFVSWTEATAVCNALSDREGLLRVYEYNDKNGAPTQSYKAMKTIVLNMSANGWRMPTEAEWEVAARAGFVGTKFPWGDYGPGALCNTMSDPSPPDVLSLLFSDDTRGPSPVQTYEPNRFGLYNIMGNVAEMCTDNMTDIIPSGIDPLGITSSIYPRYIVKGGAWYQFGTDIQIAMRTVSMPSKTGVKDEFNAGIGFRMVRFID